METGYQTSQSKNSPYVINVEAEISRGPDNQARTENSIGNLRTENATLRRELDRCFEEIDRLSRKSSPNRKSALDRFRIENEQLRQERDNMRSLMDKFERHLSEIQGNVKVLTQERDSLKRLYDEANNELRRARNDSIEAGAKGSRQTQIAQSIVRRLETERDETMADLLRMTTERDSLKERLRTLTETNLSEKARLEQVIEDLQLKVRRSEAMLNELTEVANEVRERAEFLEKENQNLQQQVNEIELERNAEGSRRNEMEARMTAMHREMNELKENLTNLNHDNGILRTELSGLSEQHQALNEHADALERELNGEREEIRRLHGVITGLEDEKKECLAREGQLSDKLISVESELRNQERNCLELQSTLSTVEQQIARAEDLASCQADQITNLNKEREQLMYDVNNLSNAVEEMRREKQKILEDVSILQRANQDLQSEMKEIADERDRYRQLADQNRGNKMQTEELLRQKEQKYQELAEQNRQLAMEADAQKDHIMSLENQMSEMQQNLLHNQNALAASQELNQKLEDEMKDLRAAYGQLQGEFETQRNANLDLQAQLRDIIEEKERILVDLTALREIVSQLEMSKDSLQHELEASLSERDQLNEAIQIADNELNSVTEQLAAEKRNVAQAEGLLAAAQEAEYANQLELQNRETELAAARERLELVEAKNESMSREIGRLRTRNTELEQSIQGYQRSLTYERTSQHPRKPDAYPTSSDAQRCSHGCYHSPECLNQLTIGPHDPSTCDHGCQHSDECRRNQEITEIHISSYNSSGSLRSHQ